ncbi:MAG: hypothetical protein KatS3mg101_1088 [Patescibacteria group bacterium]|nr:MAG: hypothetical protein KatS3mg101_1088 [Patescibacteria group bacterium]
MTIKFTIYGNQDNPTGNPVPYVRSTRGALWRKDGKRYAEWKNYVQEQLIPLILTPETYNEFCKRIAQGKKPIALGKNQKAKMDIKIFWKNRQHGDGDNVWKGIADALFENDKNLDGSFESEQSPYGEGRVEVKITIKND